MIRRALGLLLGLLVRAWIASLRLTFVADPALAEQLGSEILHPPQEWPEYYEGYYGTFWLYPFRLMLEAVCHRDDSAS
mgnify:CR=1 FL=1